MMRTLVGLRKDGYAGLMAIFQIAGGTHSNKMKLLYFFLSLLVAFSISCGGSKNGDMRIIKEVGKYHIKRLSYDILIAFVPNTTSLITYSVTDSKGNVIISCPPEYTFSDANKWYFYWDNKDQLWVNSIDIGDVVWKLDSKGRYSATVITPENSSIVDEMPYEFYNTLPNSIKREHPRTRG